jgi:serine/threonine protein kinase
MSETDPQSSDPAPRPPRSEDVNARLLHRENVVAPQGPVQWKVPPLEEVGQWFPQFQILGFLGRGGMGAVYKASQNSLDRTVAIKLLPSEIGKESDFAVRFQREARTLARLKSPRIVTVYDSGTAAGDHSFFVMEFIEGPTLANLIGSGLLTLPQALEIFLDVCEGIAAAHKQGVVHRDIKPSNVLIDHEGRAKITDFGIARLMQPDQLGMTSGVIFGTKDYMAPEQLESAAVDHRADIYALGVMLYEMLCRQVPRGQIDPPSTRAGVDPRLDGIVSKAMQNAPDRRYGTVQEMVTEVRTVSAESQTFNMGKVKTPAPGVDDSVTLQPPAAPMPTGVFEQEHFARRWGLSLLVLLAAALVIGAAMMNQAKGGKATPVPIAAMAAPTPPETDSTADSENWHDWLAEQGEKLPEGLVPTGNGYVTRTATSKEGIYLVVGPTMRDQALRITYSAASDNSDADMQLILRCSPDFKCLYRAHSYSAEWLLLRRDENGKLDTLSTIPKTPDMKKTGLRTVEFRAVGEALNFYFNGKLRGTAHDVHFGQGRARLLCGQGLVLHKIEYLDLGK